MEAPIKTPNGATFPFLSSACLVSTWTSLLKCNCHANAAAANVDVSRILYAIMAVIVLCTLQMRDSRGKRVGRCKEWVKVVGDSEVDVRVLAMRHKDRGHTPPERQALKPERVLAYRSLCRLAIVQKLATVFVHHLILP